MVETINNSGPSFSQPLSASNVAHSPENNRDDLPPLTETLSQSRRSDHRVIAAVLTMERENNLATLTAFERKLPPSQPSACQEPPFPPCLSVRIDEPVYSSISDQDAIAAHNVGLGFRNTMRAKYLAHARRSKPKIAAARKPIPVRSNVVRAPRSPTAHGGTRKADDGSGGGSSDGGSSSDGDGEPPPDPRSSRFKVLEAVR
jgi:hypothetical protein